jgi:hypothetical protein
MVSQTCSDYSGHPVYQRTDPRASDVWVFAAKQLPRRRVGAGAANSQDDEGLLDTLQRNETETPMQGLGTSNFRSDHKAFRNMVRAAGVVARGSPVVLCYPCGEGAPQRSFSGGAESAGGERRGARRVGLRWRCCNWDTPC